MDRDVAQPVESAGYFDEYARADGADRDQRGLRLGRDLAEHVHDAGHHGGVQHGGHVALSAPLVARLHRLGPRRPARRSGP